jgi:hypothetical protein
MKNTRLFVNIFLTLFLTASVFLAQAPVGYAQSTEQWSDPVNLSNSGASTDPIMIIGTDDVFHVIWVDEFDGYKYAQSIDGVKWSTPETIKYPFSPKDFPPRFEVSPDGNVHVFWVDAKNVLFHSSTPQEYVGDPSFWSSVTRVGESIVDYDVAIDRLGGIHVGLIRNESTDKESAGVYYRDSSNGGSSWSIAQTLFESPYFRSVTPEDAHISLAASDDSENGNIYVVWDDLTLKKIFMSTSVDLGNTWGQTNEIVSPDQSSGFERPHTPELEAVGNSILLTWQTGASDSRCAYSSRWSENGGVEWDETIVLFSGLGACPERIGFGIADDGYSVYMLNVQGNLAMIAWNGVEWSELQAQNDLSTFVNPVTQDPIHFGCQYPLIHKDMVFVVGCDEGNSKDIWFTLRELGIIDEWFPPPSVWSTPLDVTNVTQRISSVSSVSDEDRIHIVWAQSSFSASDNVKPAIYYAVWDGSSWSRPSPIILDLNGPPAGISLSRDNQGRLLLTWVDEMNEELLFSWANASRANIPLEWKKPSILPVPSSLISSPYLLVDGIGNLEIGYAVPFNENRGIYVIRSDNLGENWFAASQVFDAVSAKWDSNDQPQMALSGDGKLHTLFSRKSMSGEFHYDGLYYAQSADGGTTWSDPVALSDKPVYWYKIHAGDDGALHVVWQEKDGEVVASYHETSRDSGLTWTTPVKISSETDKMVMADSVMDVDGQLHFLQQTADQNLKIQEWIWNGSRWNGQEPRNVLANLEDEMSTAFSTGIAENGGLSVITALEISGNGNQMESRIISYGRNVAVSGSNATTDFPILPQPNPVVTMTDIPVFQITPTAHPLVSEMDDTSPSRMGKNILGLILVAGFVILVLIIVRPTKSGKNRLSD